eukprot:m.133831 g.133831  ORF g.133831 m.133831 type:complete len:309 (+) comp9493_c0_seq6:84-1010(+)
MSDEELEQQQEQLWLQELQEWQEEEELLLLCKLVDDSSFSPSIGLPLYWTVAQSDGGLAQRVDVTHEYGEWVSNVINKSSFVENIGRGRDSRGGSSHNFFEIVKVERVENPLLFQEYSARRNTMAKELKGCCPLMPKPPLPQRLVVDGTIDEYKHAGTMLVYEAGESLLFHGVREEATIPKIVRSGFDNRFNNLGMFGIGAYFAENGNKADEYTKGNENDHHFMVIGRVLLGDVHYQNLEDPSMRIPPRREQVGNNDTELYAHHHSVVANTKKEDPNAQLKLHREFIVYERSQAYPELIITYRRVKKE